MIGVPKSVASFAHSAASVAPAVTGVTGAPAALDPSAPASMKNPDAWMSQVVCNYPKYDKLCPTVQKRWSLRGAPLRGYQLVRMVKDTYYIRRGVALRLKNRRSITSTPRFGKRHPLNNRDEDTTRNEYSDSIIEHGYHGENRAPPYYMQVKDEDIAEFMRVWPAEVADADQCDCADMDDDAFLFWFLGAATCGEGGYKAMSTCWTDPNVEGLWSEGMVNAIEVDDDAPPDVITWIVNDANKFQSGSGFSVQQLLAVTDEYSSSWTAKKSDMKWNNKTFGKGPYSHDQQLWTHLKDTYQDDLQFRSRIQYEKVNGILHQVRQLKCMDDLNVLLKTNFNHKHKALNLETWVNHAWQCENSLRHMSAMSEVNSPQCLKSTMLLALIEFTMPLVHPSNSDSSDTSLKSSFHWKTDGDHTQIIELCNVDCKFCPRPKAAHSSTAAANGKGGATGKARRGKNDTKEDNNLNAPPPCKKRRTKATSAVTTDGAETTESNEPNTVTVKFPVAAALMIEEGISVFASNNTQIPEEIKPRLNEMAILLYNFALFGDVTVPGRQAETVEIIPAKDPRKLRKYIYSELNIISVGYMRMHGIPMQALPPAATTPAPIEDDATAADGSGDTPAHHAALADQPGAADDDHDELGEDALSATQAFALVQWLRDNDVALKLQPGFRACADRCINAFAAEPANSVTNMQAMSIIVREVSITILPEWVNEIRARPASGHFFDDTLKSMQFLNLRNTYIMTLFEQFCCGASRITSDTTGLEELYLLTNHAHKIELMRVSDATQESSEDIKSG